MWEPNDSKESDELFKNNPLFRPPPMKRMFLSVLTYVFPLATILSPDV